MKRVSVAFDGDDETRYLGYEEDGHVRFDDGDEQDVKQEWIRYVEALTEATAREDLRIEAPYPNEARIFPGKLTNVEGSRCSILFDDGDVLDDVPIENVFIEVHDDTALWDALAGSDDDDLMMGGQTAFDDDDNPAFQDDDKPAFDDNDKEEPAFQDDDKEDDGFFGEEQDVFLDDNEPRQQSFLDHAVEAALSPTTLSPTKSFLCDTERFEDDDFEDDDPDHHHPVEEEEEEEEEPGDLHPDVWGYEAGDADDLELEYVVDTKTMEPPALGRQLETLRSSQAAFLDAPPEMRLVAILYQGASLEQARAHRDVTGRSWENKTLEEGRSALGLEIDALLQLRMRAVALSRICYGTSSFETVASVLDLARAYAGLGLWTQAATHADRATGLLRSIDAKPEKRETETKGFAEVLDRLQSIAQRSTLTWAELRRVLNACPSLAEQPWGVRDQVNDTVSWDDAIAFLRTYHTAFGVAARKVEVSVPIHDLALLCLAFDAASLLSFPSDGPEQDERRGVAFPVALRAAIVRIPEAAAAFAGSPFATWLAMQCKRQLSRRENSADVVPITWEQTVCALAATSETTEDDVLVYPPQQQKNDVQRRSTGYPRWRIVEMRGAALSLAGRAQAKTSLSKGKHLLRSAVDVLMGTLRTRDGAVAAKTRAALADVLVAEHVATEKKFQSNANAAADAWLDSDEGKRLWRAEVKRLLAELRVQGTPGVVPLTRPQVERRARDVLRTARAKHARKQQPEKLSRKNLEEAKDLLEGAFAAELRTFGAQSSNLRAALAVAALGNFAVIAKEPEEAKAKLGDALRLLLAAAKGKVTNPAAAVAVQLGRLLRRTEPDRAAECLATAATFYLALAVDAQNHLNTELSFRVDLATEALKAAARKAKALWTDVAAILGSDVISAHRSILEATKLADGETSLAALKAVRKLAKLSALRGDYDDAIRYYTDMYRSAIKLGAQDIAKKANAARMAVMAKARQPHKNHQTVCSS